MEDFKVGQHVRAKGYGGGFPRYLVGELAVIVRIGRTRATLKFPNMPWEPARAADLSTLQPVVTPKGRPGGLV